MKYSFYIRSMTVNGAIFNIWGWGVPSTREGDRINIEGLTKYVSGITFTEGA